MNESRAGGPHDFVDRLVAKAFGAPDAAAPRLPSTYEPTPPGRAGLPLPGGQAGRAGDDDPDDATRLTMRGLGWDDGTQTTSSNDAPGSPGARAAASASSRFAANELEGQAATGRRRRATTPGSMTPGGASDAADAAPSASASSRSLLSQSLSSPSFAAHTRGADGEAREGDGLLVSSDVSARLGLEAGKSAHRRGASTRPDGPTADAADADDGGALGRSPFDPRAQAAARAVRGVTRPDAARDGGGDASRQQARLDAQDRGDRGAATHDVHTQDARARDGALLSRDGGLAMRLANRTAARGEDGRSRRPNGDAGSADGEVTVHVTIGRVDVRAVQASPPAGRQGRARGPQPLALDDYMTQRGGAR